MHQGRLFLSIVVLSVLATVALGACQGPTQVAEPTSEAASVVESAEPTAAVAEELPPTPVPIQSVEGVPPECAGDADERLCAVFAPGETIKIGFGGPTTGDNATFGIDISNAGLLAVKERGDVGGWKVALDVQDTQGTGEGGAAVANKFVSDPAVVAIAGHTFSGSAAAAIPIYNKARLPMLSGSATRADLTTGDQDVFNRIAFTDDVQGTGVAEYLYDKLSVRKLAILHDGDAYGKGLAEKVLEVFTAKGGAVVAFEAITKGEADYSGPLTKISAAQPDALFYGGYQGEAAVLKNQLAVSGLEKAIFFSDDGAYGTKYLELTGANGEGTYATSAVPPASLEKDKFEAAYLAETGHKAGELSTFTWHGYDIVAALISAIQKTALVSSDGNLYVPRESLVKAVRGLSGYSGLTGEITCNPQGECNTAGPTFFVVKDGAWVQAE